MAEGTRRSLFPKYEPTSADAPTEYLLAHLTAWGKRILVLAALFGTLAAAASSLGFQLLGPRQMATRVKAVEDSTTALSRRTTNLESLMRRNLYLSCQVLDRVQPARSIPPQECSPGATP